MRTILFHIPPELWGIPVFGPVVDGSITRGPGLLLALWVLFGVGLMAWLIRRQGLCADTWGYLPLLVLVGVIIWWLLPAVCEPGKGFPIRGFGTMLLTAVLAGTGLTLWRARRVGIETDVVLSLAFWMFLPGVVCARAFYVIEYWADQYLPVYQQEGLGAAVLAVANFTQGGVVAYGALLGGLLGMLLFVRRHRLPLLGLGDLVTPSIMLGLALGRIGCLLNGCCFGSPCELPWAVTFPAGDWPYSPAYQAQVQRGQLWSPTLGFTLGGGADAAPVVESVDPQSPAGRGGLEPGDRLQSVGGQNVGTAGDARLMLWRLLDEGSPVVLRAEGREPITLPAISIPRRSLPVHPTQVYSSLNALLLCLLLLAYDPFRRRDGELSALMITVYPITRFLLEIVRTDEPPIFGTGLTISQNVSLVVLLCGMGLWFCILRRPPGKAFG